MLGCLGIPAILGLILGIVGIANTRRGARRGLGLAIAAIPISLATAVVSVVAGLTILFASKLMKVPDRVEQILKAEQMSAEGVAAELRVLTSAEFNQSISSERLGEWIEEVRTKHGALKKLFVDTNRPFDASSAGAEIHMFGRFVNGNVPVVIRFAPESGLNSIRIADIDIDGVSPRDTSASPEPEPTP